MVEKDLKRMQSLCYRLAHEVPTLTREEINYIQYQLHNYCDHMKKFASMRHEPDSWTDETT